MIYVYDTLIDKTHQYKFIDRYGTRFKFEQKFIKGTQELYSFVSSSHEKMLVVPEFIKQYREIENKLSKNTATAYDACRRWVTRNVNKDINEDDFPTDECEAGTMKVIICVYRDISLIFEYFDNHMRLGKTFEILTNNLFGNNIVVDMDMADLQ